MNCQKCKCWSEVCERLENNLCAKTAELDGADAVIQHLKSRIQRLETALRDAISTYGPAPEIVVTVERQEAWKAALNK